MINELSIRERSFCFVVNCRTLPEHLLPHLQKHRPRIWNATICHMLHSIVMLCCATICHMLYNICYITSCRTCRSFNQGYGMLRYAIYAIHYSYKLCWTLPCNPMRWNAIWQLHPRIWNLLFFFRMQLHSISRFAVFANLALTCVMSWRTLTNIFYYNFITISQYFFTISYNCWQLLKMFVNYENMRNK